MDTDDVNDIIVIGSGPGGAVTSALLAEAGRSVTIIERGEHLAIDSCSHFSISEMESKYNCGGITIALGNPTVSYVEGSCVGGGSEINSGLYHRTPGSVISEWIRDYDVSDMDYSDLIPHFVANENDISVDYTKESAIPRSSFKLRDGADKLRWESIEVPRWYRERSDGNYVKQSMTETLIPRALKAGAHLVPNTEIIKLSQGGAHRSHWLLEGRTKIDGKFISIKFKARTVFLCSGTIGTASILLKSRLGSMSGRSLCMHPSVKIVAKFPDIVNSTNAGVAVHQVKEFSPKYSFGCSISTPPYLNLAMMDVKNGGEFTKEHWRNMSIYYSMTSGGKGSVTNIPFFQNPIVKYQVSNDEIQTILEGMINLARCLYAAGAESLFPSVKNSQEITCIDDFIAFVNKLHPSRLNLMTIHLLSSCPMGENLTRCVVNSYGKLHGVDGIYVNDGSIVPTALGVNPQGTIMALARRNVQNYLRSDGA